MKKFFLHLISCFFLLFAMSAGHAQQTITVQGKVLDADKSPLQGVTVAEVDQDSRTIKAVRTDVDGNFSLKVTNTKNRITFSFIGYTTTDLAIGTRTTFNVNLQSASKD